MKNLKIRLLYLIYHENLIHSGILRGQVIKLLEELSKRKEIEDICLLSFVNPVSVLKSKSAWSSLSADLRSRGIRLKLYPMLFPIRWSFAATLLSVVHCLPFLLFTLYSGKYNILHTRSYAAGFLGHLGSKIFTTIHIFDPRGPMPEEMAHSGYWLEGRYTFKFWKHLEQRIIGQSSTVVAVTPGYKQQFRERGARKAVFIPSRCDIDLFHYQSNLRPNPQRPQFLFIGSTWSRHKQIAGRYLLLKSKIPNLQLRLITRMQPEIVRQSLSKLRMNDSDWSVESASPEEIPAKIRGSSFGYLLTSLQQSEGVWPVKMAEYLACGIPLAVEETVGLHLTQLVEKWNLGIVFREDDQSFIQKAAEIVKGMPEYRDKCRWFAKKYLDISSSANQYLRLYRQELRTI